MKKMALNNGVELYEGVITSEKNKRFLEELNGILKDSAANIGGGSFIEGKIWLGVDVNNSGECFIARKIMNTFGIDELVLNGHYYHNDGQATFRCF